MRWARVELEGREGRRVVQAPRDLERLRRTEASRTWSVREAFGFRPSVRRASGHDRLVRDSIRDRITTLRAIRFAIKVLES